MKDLFRDYSQKTKKQYVLSGTLALFLAIFINIIFTVSGASPLRADISQAVHTTQRTQADISLHSTSSGMYIQTSRDMQDVSRISITIFYDASSIVVGTATSSVGTVSPIAGTPGIARYDIRTTPATDISATAHILDIAYTVLDASAHSVVQVSQAEFSSGESTYRLTSQTM
jgi:hypothetical protein